MIIKKIKISKVISKNLLLRKSANELFNHINKINHSKIIIDFNKVQSITRAFTHQYLQNKIKNKKNITEVNITPEIKEMFNLVDNSILPSLLTYEQIKESSIYNTFSEEFKRDLPNFMESIKENHNVLIKLSKENIENSIMSESSLEKDWLSEKDEEAWKDL